MATKKKSLLTKVSKGIAFGDVSNAAVRNVLTEISKRVFGGITENQMEETKAKFGNKCPYTGKDLDELIKEGNYATDHVYPQNREYCGLNVMGNLVIVDKAANAEKRNKSVEDFMLDPKSKVLAGVDMETRKARLAKIKEFQAKYHYDPDEIKAKIAPLLTAWYDEVRKQQVARVDEAIRTLGITPIVPIKEHSKGRAAGRTAPSIVYYIGSSRVNEDDFKKELLVKKEATIVLSYCASPKRKQAWNASSLKESSDLSKNIKSRDFWRKKDETGLLKVEIVID